MIDHAAESLTKAIDMNEDELNKLMEKCQEIISSMKDGKDKLSQVYENIMVKFSYKELVFLSTQSIVSLYKDYTEKRFEHILQILEKEMEKDE
jgi:hypothetical protein